MAVLAEVQARLTRVQTAIDAILDDQIQEYDLDGQKVTRLDLTKLVQMESTLSAKVARMSRKGGAFRTVAPR